MLSKDIKTTENLRSEILGKKTTDIGVDGAIYQLLTKIGGLGEIVGRVFEVHDPSGKLLATITQKPINLLGLTTLFREAQKQDEREQKEMDKSNRKGKR